MRKLLGNEEFCLQLDAHSTMAQHWDAGLTQEWQTTANEFAVLSTIPVSTKSMSSSEATLVPRQCEIILEENGVPNYNREADAYVDGLSRPLLSHSWSAAFSFAKCHLEETVPYDPFSAFAMTVEQFVRYARMWTRGYDTYTPTKNYVFHDYGEQKNGHGDNEWFKQFLKNQLRLKAIDRAKLVLELPGLSEESDTIDADRANMGVYGLGQRRTLAQMKKFINYETDKEHENHMVSGLGCVEELSLVRYESKISPLADLHYDGATKLDPYPIFPLRTLPIFSKHHVISAEGAKHLPDQLDTEHLVIAVDETDESAKIIEAANNSLGSRLQGFAAGLRRHNPMAAIGPVLLEQSNLPSSSLLFVLWILGLMTWYFLFALKQHSLLAARGRGGDEKNWLSKATASATNNTNSSSSTKKTTSSSAAGRKTKMVKDV